MKQPAALVRRRAARSGQRGQSTAEFLIAALALVPLFIGVAYAGRYADVQQSAVQASRYAAFQRAMQPDSKVLSDATLQDQVRARFFTRGDYANKGELRTADSVKGLSSAKGQNPVWRDLGFGSLLKDHQQVSLKFDNGAIGNGAAAKVLDAQGKLYGKSWDGLKVAQVEVNLVNKMDQVSATPKALKIGAATAAAGNAWNTKSSKDTRDRIAATVPGTLIPEAVEDLIGLAMLLFEDSSPEFGCIKPDLVQGDRLDTGKMSGQGCK